MTTELRFYQNDLTTYIGSLTTGTPTGPYDLQWFADILEMGIADFFVPHNNATLQSKPTMLDKENLVKVRVDGTDVYAFVIREREREEGDSFDPVEVRGKHVKTILGQALVYMPFGIDGILVDNRQFGWQGIDYETTDPGWVDPPSLGTYANPTDDTLKDVTTGDNEIQSIELNADTSGFPWGDGSTYPSPGGLPGTFTLSHEGNETAPLDHVATLAQIESALEALAHIDGVTVGGTGPTGTFTVEFDGPEVGGQKQSLLSLNHSTLRHQSPSTQDNYVERVQVGDPSIDGEDIAEGWPDQDAEWIGNFGETWHHRRVLRFGDDGHPKAQKIRVHIVSLEKVEFWWDGKYMSEAAGLDILTYDIEASAHDHVIAIRADAPTLVSITQVNEDNEPGYVLYRSASGIGRTPHWESYLGDPPGVNAGFLLGRLFDEAKSRGYLPPVTKDFDDTNDSTGAAWSVDIEMGVQVGNDSVLSVAERLSALGLHFDLSPDLVLSVWEGDRVDRSGTASLTVSEVHDKQWKSEDELFSALLIRTEDRWIERHRAGPRREGFVSLGNISSTRGAEAIADAVLEEFQEERAASGWSYMNDQPGVPQPGVDYFLGDIISGPRLASILADWGVANIRVEAIHGEVQDNGELKISLEVTT